MITPTLKLFNDCTEGELIRFTEGGQTHWAVVGARGHERLMLLVLPLNSPPYCENILGAMDALRPPYEATPVLSYGRDYSIHINHAGDCDVGGGGTLIRTPGSYVITEKDHYICCRDDRVASKIGYFDLESGAVRGEPGGLRAIFAEWELTLSDRSARRSRMRRVRLGVEAMWHDFEERTELAQAALTAQWQQARCQASTTIGYWSMS